AQSCDLDDGATGDVGHAGPHVRLEGDELGAVDAAERLPEVVDAAGVQVGGTVAVDVDADLEHAHELHEVGDRLPQAVAVAHDSVGPHGAGALHGLDRAVAVLIDAAPAVRNGDGQADGRNDGQGAAGVAPAV